MQVLSQDNLEQREMPANLVVTLGPSNYLAQQVAAANPRGVAPMISKELNSSQFDTFDQLKDTLRREFEISHMDEFNVLLVNENGN